MSDGVRFYIDTDPATAGDRKFLARHERGKAGLCWFGPTRKGVEEQVATWAAKEAAGLTAGTPRLAPRAGKAAAADDPGMSPAQERESGRVPAAGGTR